MSGGTQDSSDSVPAGSPGLVREAQSVKEEPMLYSSQAKMAGMQCLPFFASVRALSDLANLMFGVCSLGPGGGGGGAQPPSAAAKQQG